MDFNWAVNKMKLQLSISELKRNPNVVIDEETIKDVYIKKGGLVDKSDVQIVTKENANEVVKNDEVLPVEKTSVIKRKKRK